MKWINFIIIFLFIFLRSTVHSATIAPSTQQSFTPDVNKQISEKAPKFPRVVESRGLRPPPKVPTGINNIIYVLPLTFFWAGDK